MNTMKDILRGVMIGISNIIPGVSGGTMMVSMGIYDKIISSITDLPKHFIRSFKTLLPYGIGMGIGIVGLSFFIEQLFTRFPLETAMAFVGLIFGGIPMMMKKVKSKQKDFFGIFLLLLFFVLILGMGFLGDNHINRSIELSFTQGVIIFLVGIIAAATMVVPGVSGSMILLLLGYYNPILSLVNQTVKAMISFDMQLIIQNGLILAPFVLGVIIGIFAVVKLIEYLLSKYEQRTYYAILGLILASPFVVLKEIGISTIQASSVLIGAVTFTIGFAMAFYLGKEK